jgi:hypothetical protein
MMTFPIYGKMKFMFQTTNQIWYRWPLYFNDSPIFSKKKHGDFPVRYAELPGGNQRQLGVHLRTLDVFFPKSGTCYRRQLGTSILGRVDKLGVKLPKWK